MPAAGYEIDFLDVRGIDRKNPIKAAAALGKATMAVGAARKLLRARETDVVMGGGGYVAAPAGIAALGSGRPLVLTEADSHFGLANRLLAPRARRVCLAFPIEGRDGARYLVTGRPVPAAIGHADRAAARRRYGIAPEDRCLLIFGGSLGALTINQAAAGAFEAGGPAPAATSTSCTSPARATTRSSPRGSPAWTGTRCSSTSRTSRTPSPRPTSSSPAQGARSSSSRPRASRGSSSPIPMPRPATSTRTQPGWRGRAPRS